MVETIEYQTLKWLHITNPSEEEYRYLLDEYHFHPLDIEDCRGSNQRPKIDEYDDYYFLILHFPYFDKGVLPGLEGCLRIYPHKVRGEGHFAALLHRRDSQCSEEKQKEKPETFRAASLSDFLKHIQKELDPARIVRNKDRVLLEPEGTSAFSGIRTLRSGLLLGTMKNDRFEPSQHLAFSLKGDEFDQVIRLEPGDERVQKYLRGETVFTDSEARGWVLVCAGDYPLGFGICRDKVIKNKIDKAWRKI